MPHFCVICGADEYICQVCGRVRCSKEKPSEWMTPVPGKQFNGNVCPDCKKDIKEEHDAKV